MQNIWAKLKYYRSSLETVIHKRKYFSLLRYLVMCVFGGRGVRPCWRSITGEKGEGGVKISDLSRDGPMWSSAHIIGWKGGMQCPWLANFIFSERSEAWPRVARVYGQLWTGVWTKKSIPPTHHPPPTDPTKDTRCSPVLPPNYWYFFKLLNRYIHTFTEVATRFVSLPFQFFWNTPK